MIDELQRRFLGRFVGIARERLGKAMASVGQDDGAAATRAELHALAGEAAMLGVVDVADAARAAETAAASWRDQGDARARAECARAIRTMVRSVDGLAARVPGSPAAASPAAASPAAASPAAAPAVPRATRRVLVVDDSALVAAQLAEAFARTGLEVEVVGDVGEALAAADRLDPDLIVTDVNLPGGTGDELCRRLRAKGSAARVWLVSGADDAELAQRAAAAGATGHVSKRAGLDAVVARVLR